MKKFAVCCLLLLMAMTVFGFETHEEKLQAIKMISVIEDVDIRIS